MNETDIERLGYAFPRQLEDGRWIALLGMVYTRSLVVGINDDGYKERYCYGTTDEAVIGLVNWDGKGDPQGHWVKHKPSERLGPGAKTGDAS